MSGGSGKYFPFIYEIKHVINFIIGEFIKVFDKKNWDDYRRFREIDKNNYYICDY